MLVSSLPCAGYSTGGNNAHLAPEVLNAKPGPRRFINYTKQPVWAAGVLVYELAGECMHTYNNIISVSPRINEKECTEREIVSGGLVLVHTSPDLMCSYPLFM